MSRACALNPEDRNFWLCPKVMVELEHTVAVTALRVTDTHTVYPVVPTLYGIASSECDAAARP